MLYESVTGRLRIHGGCQIPAVLGLYTDQIRPIQPTVILGKTRMAALNDILLSCTLMKLQDYIDRLGTQDPSWKEFRQQPYSFWMKVYSFHVHVSITSTVDKDRDI